MSFHDPSSIGIAIWTLASVFLGALLGVAGKRFGVDVYRVSKEYIDMWVNNYEYRNSELSKQMEKIPTNIRICCDILGTSSSTEIDYENWNKTRNEYEDKVEDRFDKVIKELKKEVTIIQT